ncbi:conserved protein of unknown function [Methanocaldococcus lauensis]|nr:conserved protein of unknown function [Methanocaldococcus lauensis]
MNIEKFIIIDLNKLEDFIKKVKCPKCFHTFNCVGKRVICPNCKIIIKIKNK